MVMGIGCSGPTQEQTNAAKPITLTYWTVFGNTSELKRLADEYKKIRPYVSVSIRQLRYEEFDKIFVNALADEVGPDIVSVHTRWLGKYQQRLDIMPATVKVAKIEVKEGLKSEKVITLETNRMPTLEQIKTNYVSTVADDISIGKDAYGLPFSVDTLALFYNKDLTDAAQIAVPPATWPQFLEAVKKATKFDKKGKIIQAGAAMGTGKNVDNVFDIMSLLMTQNGVKMAKGNLVTFADGIAGNFSVSQNHPALEALRFYTDFARPTKEIYTWNNDFGNALDEFASGKAVYFIGFSYDLARIRARAPQLNIGVSPVPQLNEAAPVNVANYWMESVSKKSSKKNEAWDFLRFVSTPNTLKSYAEASGTLSPLRAHVDAEKENNLMKPFAEGILSARNWYRGKDIDAANIAMKDMVEKYLAPYSDAESRNPLQRDAGLVLNAATVIQQTF